MEKVIENYVGKLMIEHLLYSPPLPNLFRDYIPKWIGNEFIWYKKPPHLLKNETTNK